MAQCGLTEVHRQHSSLSVALHLSYDLLACVGRKHAACVDTTAQAQPTLRLARKPRERELTD